MPYPSVKKILMTADTIGGVWSYALDLCKEFTQYGIEVHLATMGNSLSDCQKDESQNLDNLVLYESNYRLEWMEAPWEDVAAAGKWLLKLEEAIQPDVIHLNNYAHGNLAWKAPVIMVAHSCVSSWWQAVKKEPTPPDWDEYNRKIRQGLQTVDVVVGISNSYMQVLKKLHGSFKKEAIIYNGCDASDFQVLRKKDKIFAMGRIWDEAKNLSILGQISGKVPYPIYIAGNQKNPSNGKEISLSKGHLLGQLSREEVKKQLGESLIYVLPAKYEPFGLSALEAALSGCLLILADIPTLREIWGDTALYFNPEDQESLLNAINWTHENPEQRLALSSKSFNRAQHFSLKKVCQQYLQLYHITTAPKEKAGAIF